jgi:hypothetical protein
MNKPDFATQWESLAMRIAHIERMVLAGLAVFGAVVGFVIQKQISTNADFWLFAGLLAFLSFSYLHLMFILSLHAQHIVALERESKGEFYVFLEIFRGISVAFYVGYGICAMMPACVTALIAFLARHHAGSYPVAIYLVVVLGVASFMTFAAVKMLVTLRSEMANAQAEKPRT